VDYYYGKQAASEYVIGTRSDIGNAKPIIGTYNVNKEGSPDMYSKGANMLHTLRTWLDDDVRWRETLRGLQRDFYHQTVNTAQIETYMAQATGLDLKSFFNQYLRDTRIPVLEYNIKGKTFNFRYTNIVEGFNMPVWITIDNGEKIRITPTSNWQKLKQPIAIKTISIDQNFYIQKNMVDKLN
jgi:aminopeptidase N